MRKGAIRSPESRPVLTNLGDNLRRRSHQVLARLLLVVLLALLRLLLLVGGGLGLRELAERAEHVLAGEDTRDALLVHRRLLAGEKLPRRLLGEPGGLVRLGAMHPEHPSGLCRERTLVGGDRTHRLPRVAARHRQTRELFEPADLLVVVLRVTQDTKSGLQVLACTREALLLEQDVDDSEERGDDALLDLPVSLLAEALLHGHDGLLGSTAEVVLDHVPVPLLGAPKTVPEVHHVGSDGLLRDHQVLEGAGEAERRRVVLAEVRDEPLEGRDAPLEIADGHDLSFLEEILRLVFNASLVIIIADRNLLSSIQKDAIMASSMRILAIETSCDETAVSLLECTGTVANPLFTVLGTGLYSQASKHAEYGGVYPNLAKREHQRNLIPMLKITLEKSGLSTKHQAPSTKEILNVQKIKGILEKESSLSEEFLQYLNESPRVPNIDAIAVTQGPGLEPALWVGLNFAKALSFAWNIPLIPVNHMEGHVLSVLHENGEKNPNDQAPNHKEITNDQIPITKQNSKIEFPAIALLISGGHTELILVRDWLSYERIGETRDDAVGEAFDKVARLIGLPYPGGPAISRLAAESRSKNQEARITLPRPMLTSDDYDFSFSGLKTAVLYDVKKQTELTDTYKQELARAFEDAVTDVLAAKTKRAMQEYGARSLIVGGGVAANTYIRDALAAMVASLGHDARIFLPTRELSTDNAVMIGIAGFLNYTQTPRAFGVFDPSHDTFRAQGTMRI